MNSGRLRTAARLLQRALEVSGSPAMRARVEASLAFVATDTGDLGAALSRCDAALAFVDLPADVRAVLTSQRAAILRRRGDLPGAMAAWDEAMPGLAAMPAELGRALLNRGFAFLDLGDPLAARRDYGHAAEAFAEASDPILGAKAQHNRGYAEFRAGDFVSALATMTEAHTVLAPVSPLTRAIGQQDRAEVLMAAGLRVEGERLLREASAGYGQRRLRRHQAEVELVLAGQLQLSDPEIARQVARRARARFARLGGAERWVDQASAEVLEAEVGLGGSSDRLLAEARRLRHGFEQHGPVWRGVTCALAEARILTRRGSLADATAAVAAARVRSSAPLAVRLAHADVRAEIEAAAGRSTQAFRQLRRGLADLHAWQSSFGSLDLQTNVSGHGRALAMRGLTLAVESRRAATLFEWSERARMLASRIQPVRAPRNDEIAAGLAELRGDVTPEREAELRSRIRELAWQHEGSREVVDPVSLRALQEQLGATSLVAYVATEDRLVALHVTAAKARWHDLGETAAVKHLLGGLLPDLDVAASDLPGSMATAVRGELVARLDRLHALLVDPLSLGDGPVVLTPSGLLAGVPWSLLLPGRAVTVAQSATSWLARRATPLRLNSAGFVAGPRVARAEGEARAAAKEWPGATVLAGDEATADEVTSLASRVDVLHVAAHGRHSSENPLFSGLQLADGTWFGYDIDQLEAVPDVVLLSACEVGRSSVRWGEELIGMTAAWLHAGARCVVASPAAVNDEAAYDVLVALHRGLATGLDPAAALGAAVAPASADRPPAPFLCFG